MNSLFSVIPLLLLLLIIGTFACLPLFGWNMNTLLRSSTGLKIVVWIPLYFVFVAAVLWPPVSSVGIGLVISCLAIREWVRYSDSNKMTIYYLMYFLIGCLAWPLSIAVIVSPLVWVAICMTSVMSDVVAYFMGNFIGIHKLPTFINDRKSYEGAIGQIIGGVAGALLFSATFDLTFDIGTQLLIGYAIGITSMLGDLFNSFTKRLLTIKDWGNTIPGHGGVMDRFSSLNMTLIVATVTYTFFAI